MLRNPLADSTDKPVDVHAETRGVARLRLTNGGFFWRHWLRALLTLPLALLAGGCYGEMDHQPKFRHLSPSGFYSDGAAARTPPGGTVARETVPAREPLTAESIHRGQQRFNIYCLPCHGAGGAGDGQVVQHGFPAPPSFHIERLLKADDEHFFGVITNGAGRMFPYADRVSVPDRWAIVGYIRALQLSQRVPYAQLDAAAREKVK